MRQEKHVPYDCILKGVKVGDMHETFKQHMAQNHPKTWPNSYFWKQVQNDWNNALECAAKLKELTPENIRKLKSPVTKTVSKNRPKTFKHASIDPHMIFSKMEG